MLLSGEKQVIIQCWCKRNLGERGASRHHFLKAAYFKKAQAKDKAGAFCANLTRIGGRGTVSLYSSITVFHNIIIYIVF